MPKFDVVIGNPPYKRDLHLKFLDLAIDISKEFVCFIEPAGWILNEKMNKRPKFEIKIKKKISKYKLSLELHNPNKLFPEIKIKSYLNILFIDKKTRSKIIVENKINGEIFKYDDINQISKYGNSPTYLSLKEKIIDGVKKNGNLSEYHNKCINGIFFVLMPSLSGSMNNNLNSPNIFGDDFYIFGSKNIKIGMGSISNNGYDFLTKSEAENFLNYLKTNFARFALSISKITISLWKGELASVPWLDFTESWDDAKLYKYFKLTPDEIKFIEERIPKYYA